MGQNFHRFRGLPNICENKFCELRIIVFSFCTVSQHLRKFYPRIFLEPSRKFCPAKIPRYTVFHCTVLFLFEIQDNLDQ